MKKKTFIFFATIFAISGVMLSSCSKIEAEREGNEIRLRNETNDGEYLQLLKVDSAWHRYGILVNNNTGSVTAEDSYRSLSARLLIDGQDNFCFYNRDDFYDYSYDSGCFSALCLCKQPLSGKLGIARKSSQGTF